ncbi:MAG TPA: RNase H family protein, partial [Acidimicrobiales bacterium]|nr:RNase H family protein [Acidimicrobiales bacterium]
EDHVTILAPADRHADHVRIVYTDGACLGNPGPGGWAWAVPDGPYAAGPDPATTNQRMEIRAVLEAVQALDGPLEVVSDSTYVVNCFRDRWWEGWLARGWLNKAKKPVANRDLWEPLITLYRAEPQRLRFRWVKGHGNDRYNDLVDRLAVQAARTQQSSSGAGAPVGPLPEPDVAGGPRVPEGRRLVVGGDRARAADLRELLAAKATMHPDLVVLSGMDLGAAQAGAEAAIEVGVPLVAVLPFPDFDARWPADVRVRYRRFLDAAVDRVVLQSKVPDSKPKLAAAFSRRDAWLARHAHEAVLVWDGVDPFVGRLVRSFQDHLGEEDVWIVEPA